MNTKKFRINPHYCGVWAKDYKQSDGTTGYGKYAIVHDSTAKLASYMSLVETNISELTDSTSWMVFADINSVQSYIDKQITEHTQDLIKEQLNVSLTFTGGGAGWGDTPPTITLYDQNDKVIESKEASKGAPTTFQILPRTQYRIVATPVSDYKRPKEYYYTALSNYVRDVTLEYRYIAAGVSIQLIDKTLVDTDSFNPATMQANGVFVSDGTNSVVVALQDTDASIWGAYNVVVPYITTSTSAAVAIADFGGEANQAAADKYMSENSVTMPAFKKAETFVFPTKAIGYLPAAGELKMIMTNFDTVNSAVVKAGGVAMQNGSAYWSSTQCSAAGAWYEYSSGVVSNYGKVGACAVRAVTAY